ncbi:MAG: gliding motility-associated C-terminal domain-containing protein [Lewinella sp.]|nr:gliding motility-associated C-terminal domain-containing protein [Lewinella sp.]
MALDVCQGEIVTLAPTGGGSFDNLTFAWSPATGLDDPTSPTPSFIATGDIIYTVTITPENPVCTSVQSVAVSSVEVPNASFTTEVGCEQGLTINFTGTSDNADSFAWDFGDPNTTDDTSTDANPAYTYPATGDYLVTLIATNAGLCSDTVQQTVTVDSVRLMADFVVSYDSCSPDSVTVHFTDNSINEANNTVSYLWEFSSGQSSNAPAPTITLFDDQTIIVTLTINTADNCVSSVTRSVLVQLAPPTDQFPEELLVCPGGSTQIMPGGDPAYQYSWSPTTGIDDPSSPAPVFSPTATTVYTVSVTSIGADTCTTVEMVTVTVPPAIGLTIDGDGVVCTPTATLTASTSVMADIVWTNALGDTLSTGSELTVPVSGSMPYTAIATDANGCEETATGTLSGGPVDVEVPDTVAVCLGDEILLSVNNLDLNDTLTYNWLPAELFAPGTQNSPTPDFLEAVGEYLVTVELSNQYGCTTTADIVVAVIDPNINLSFTSMLDCTGATVVFTNTSTDAFGFIWTFGDGSAPSLEVNPTHSYDMAGTYTVTLDLVYDVDCFTPFTAEVTTQDPQVQANFAYDIVECSADSAVIAFTNTSINTFNNTTGYEWTFDTAVPASSMEENPVVTFFGGGTLTVTLTIMTANDCPNTRMETLEIQLADLDLVDTLVICPGDSTPLNPDGDPDLVYNWTPADGLDDPTAFNPTASPSATTTYYATAFTAVGSDTCFVSDSVVVFVAPALNLDLGDETITTCGEDVTLTASLDAPATVTWTSTTEGPLGTGPTITVNPFRTDTIIAVAEDEYGCMASDTVVIIDNGVDVTLEPSDNFNACEGVSEVMFVSNQDDLDTLTYSWMPAENILGPTDTDSVTIFVDEPGSVTFTVIVTNQLGCMDTLSATATVIPFEGNLPDTVPVCPTIPTPLHPEGNETYTYVWSPETGLDLTEPWNPVATLTEDQVYTVSVTDPSTGCSTVDTVYVEVSPAINLMTTGDTTLCELVPITMTATADVPVDIVWYYNDEVIDMGSSTTQTAGNGTNVYTAIATDPMSGCMDTSSVVINVQVLQDELPADTVQVCAFEPTELNPGGDPGLTYVWSPEDEFIDLTNPANPIVTATGTDLTYYVTITDPDFGCTVLDTVTVLSGPPINLMTAGDTALCELTTLTLTATTDSPVDIVWYYLGEVAGNGNTLMVTPPDGDHTYTAIATDLATGCADTSDVSIKVQLFTDELPFGDVTVCANESTAINPGGDPNFDYEWSPDDAFIDLTNPWNPVVTTDMPLTYFVTVTDPAFGCVVIDTVNIELYPEMNLSVGEDMILCGGETLNLTATTDIEPSEVAWFQLPNNEPVGTGANITITPQLGSTQYYAIATSADGCTESDTLQVDNYPINALITEAFVVCEPTTEETLSVVNLDPAQEITVTWDPTGVITSPPAGETVTVDPSVTDEFTAFVVNQYGCQATLNTTVTIVDLAGTLNAFANPDTILLGQSTTLTVTGCVGCDYEWMQTLGTGDIFPTDEAVVDATPAEFGNMEYEVVTSLLGCIDFRIVEVFVINAVCDADHLFFPNAFSPNGDGENDVLRLRTSFADEIIEMDLHIYDRWGEEVFSTKNPYDGWDGTFRGDELPPDVYGYYLRVVCPDEEELIQKGNVTLLR